MSTIDTPRTDEQINGKPCTRFAIAAGDTLRDALIPSDFARTLERELAQAKAELKWLTENDEVALLRAEVARLRLFEARLKWLHTGGEKDADGCEWGVFRVKWDANGQPVEVWQTLSDMSDLDAEMMCSEWYQARIAGEQLSAALNRPENKAALAGEGEK